MGQMGNKNWAAGFCLRNAMVPSSQRHHQRQHWARHRLCGSLPLYSGRGGRQQIIQTLEGKETLHFVSGTAMNTTILTFGYG